MYNNVGTLLVLEPIVFCIGIDWLCLFLFFCGLDGGRSELHPPCVVASASLVVYFWFVVSLSYFGLRL